MPTLAYAMPISLGMMIWVGACVKKPRSKVTRRTMTMTLTATTTIITAVLTTRSATVKMTCQYSCQLPFLSCPLHPECVIFFVSHLGCIMSARRTVVDSQADLQEWRGSLPSARADFPLLTYFFSSQFWVP